MGMLNLRRRVMKGGDVIPYQRVEYLENAIRNNCPFIQTEYFITDIKTEVYISFMRTSSDGGQILSNQHSIADSDYHYRIYDNIGSLAHMYNNYASGPKCTLGVPANKINNIHTYTDGKNICYIEDVDTKKVSSSSIQSYFNNPYPLRLFASYFSSTPPDYYGWVGRIYYLKIFYDKKLALHLLPVRIGDVGYMYDKVSGKLFGNSGEGKFILGPDI